MITATAEALRQVRQPKHNVLTENSFGLPQSQSVNPLPEAGAEAYPDADVAVGQEHDTAVMLHVGILLVEAAEDRVAARRGGRYPSGTRGRPCHPERSGCNSVGQHVGPIAGHVEQRQRLGPHVEAALRHEVVHEQHPAGWSSRGRRAASPPVPRQSYYRAARRPPT